MSEIVNNDSTSNEGTEISLLDLFHPLWFWRKLFFVIVVIVIGIGYIYMNSLIPKYTATATLKVNASSNGQVANLQAILGQTNQNYYIPATTLLNTEKEVLRSRGLARKVIGKLNLLNEVEFNPSIRIPVPQIFPSFNFKNFIPDEWKTVLRINEKVEDQLVNEETDEQILEKQMVQAVDIFLSKLKIEVAKTSNIIRVNFVSLKPELAASITNAVSEGYILEQLEAKFNATKRTTEWLDKQLFDLKKKVSDAEKAVEYYKQKHGFTQGSKAGLSVEQLSAINSQLIIAKAKRVELDARYQQVKRLLSQNSHGRLKLEATSEILKSVQIQSLQLEESKLERKMSELAVEYGVKHPKILQLKAEIKNIKKKIRIEIEKIIISLKNEVDVARRKELSLINSLKALGKKTATEDKQSVQLRALEREAAANRTLFNTFLSQFKETSSIQGMQQADATILSKAEIPTSASYPNKRKMKVMIFLVGIMAGSMVVFLLISLNTSLQSPEQIEQDLGLSVLGIIPINDGEDINNQVIRKPNSGYSEAFNSLHISIMLLCPDKPKKIIQITSSVPEEGKSTVALSLAQSLSLTGKKVIIIDADLRRPTLAKNLGVSSKMPGLIDLVLSDNTQLKEHIREHESMGISYLLGGAKLGEHVNSTEIFASARMKSIIKVLNQYYDYVIFDTPPIMAVSDSRILGHLVDETLYVVRWNVTPKKVIKAALKQFKSDGVMISGCIFQQVNMKRYDTYGYGGSGYYYHYSRYRNYYAS